MTMLVMSLPSAQCGVASWSYSLACAWDRCHISQLGYIVYSSTSKLRRTSLQKSHKVTQATMISLASKISLNLWTLWFSILLMLLLSVSSSPRTSLMSCTFVCLQMKDLRTPCLHPGTVWILDPNVFLTQKEGPQHLREGSCPFGCPRNQCSPPLSPEIQHHSPLPAVKRACHPIDLAAQLYYLAGICEVQSLNIPMTLCHVEWCRESLRGCLPSSTIPL